MALTRKQARRKFSARKTLAIFTKYLSRTEQLLVLGYFFSLVPIERGDSPSSIVLKLLKLVPTFSKVTDFFESFPTSIISIERDVAKALGLLPVPRKQTSDEFTIRLLTFAFQNATLDLQDQIKRVLDLESVVSFLQGRISEQEMQLAHFLSEPDQVMEVIREVVVEVPVFVEKIVEVVVPGVPDLICEEARQACEQEVEDLLQEKERQNLRFQGLKGFSGTVRDTLVETISRLRGFLALTTAPGLGELAPPSQYEDQAAFLATLNNI